MRSLALAEMLFVLRCMNRAAYDALLPTVDASTIIREAQRHKTGAPPSIQQTWDEIIKELENGNKNYDSNERRDRSH